MSDNSELEQARSEMLSVLDVKFASVPEWRAYRVIDRLLMTMGDAVPGTTNGSAHRVRRQGRGRRATGESYADLGLKAIREAGTPLRTEKLLEFIGTHRSLAGDPKKIRINVQSSLSKDPRVVSIAWEGARAWWFADKPPPGSLAAGTVQAPAARH